jgi:hypothetical protein
MGIAAGGIYSIGIVVMTTQVGGTLSKFVG